MLGVNFAIGCACVILLLGAANYVAYVAFEKYETQRSQRQLTDSLESSKSNHHKLCALDTQKNDTKSSDRHQPVQKDLQMQNVEAQEKIARTSIWSAVFQFLTVALVGLTVRLTSKTLQATRETLDAAKNQTRVMQEEQQLRLRPWLEFIEVDLAEPTREPQDRITFTLHATLRNSGPTAIRNINLVEEDSFAFSLLLGDREIESLSSEELDLTEKDFRYWATTEQLYHKNIFLAPNQSRMFFWRFLVHDVTEDKLNLAIEESSYASQRGVRSQGYRQSGPKIFPPSICATISLPVTYSDLVSDAISTTARHECVLNIQVERDTQGAENTTICEVDEYIDAHK